MSSVRDWHDRAMELADGGFRERARGDTPRAQEFFAQALAAELAAIQELDEPNGLLWSILYRSAGTLALDCNRLRQAEQIVATALAGEPHPDIAEELRDLLEQIYFQRHLELQGVALTDSELQFSLAGPEVGLGFAELSEVFGRVDSSAQLIYRTAERKQDLDFQERRRPTKAIRESHRTFLSPPRKGSFAVSLKFGNPVQPGLPGMFDPADPVVLDEFMNLISLVNRGKVDEIGEIIPDPDYRRNFFALVKKIAPDGAKVHHVGLTAIRAGKEQSVELTKPAAELPKPGSVEPAPDSAKSVEIVGVLRFADTIRGGNKNTIQVLEDDRKRPTRITVPPGMMNDIVRPMWDLRVVIQATRIGKIITLEDIQLDEDAE